MGLKKFRPLTPTLRYKTVSDFSEITESKPKKSLLRPLKKSAGIHQHESEEGAGQSSEGRDPPVPEPSQGKDG